MDSYNFMTFSVGDKVSCIQYFREGQIFVATSNSIKVYDLTLSATISQFHHSIMKNLINQKENSKYHEEQGTQTNHKQPKQQDQTLSAFEMHYFSNHQESSSSFKQQLSQIHGDTSLLTEWKDDKQEKRKTLGYLLVHYKMTGLSTYKIQQSQSEQDKPFSFTCNKPSIIISFESFLPVKFGSAFLNLSFLTGIYHQTNSKANKEVKGKYLTHQNCTNTESLETDLKSHMNLADFILEDKGKTRQFMIFENDNQLFQIKRITLNNEGLLQIMQSFQIDEQSAKLNSSTVTALKYFEYHYDLPNKKNSFLIMAMEAGDILVYQLPYLQAKFPNSEHYLEPIQKLNVKKFLQFQPKKQDLDYSVISIQLIHQSMALLLVRNCGILLMNLKDFTILNHLSLTTAPKKTYFFTDIRLIASLRSQLSINPIVIESSQQDQTKINEIGLIKKLTNQKLQISLILASKSSLKNLSIQLKIDKILEQSQHEGRKQFKIVQKVQTRKIKCNIIEQLNTPLIENLLIIKHNHPNNLAEDSFNQATLLAQSLDQEIQIFGNYQMDKIFYLTP